MKAKLNYLKGLSARAHAKAVASGTTLMVIAGSAAADPITPDGGFTAAFTALRDSAADMFAAGWPVLIAITGGMILMGLGKKVMKRSAS